jgi:RimJ/RimL family protein N-acetyltransferase
MVIETREASLPVGLLQIVNADFRSGHAGISVLLRPEFIRRGWPLEGILLVVNYAFLTWPFRKLYFESVEPTAALYRGALGPYLQEEGRLLGHEFINGAYVDYHILALYRSTWEDNGPLVDLAIRHRDDD